MTPPTAPTHGTAARAAVLAAAFAALVTWYTAGSFYKNAWSIVDDHEMLSWFAERDRVLPSEFGRLLARTEVLNRWVANRYRPVYWTVRVAEATVLGKEAVRWHAIHVSILAASVFLLAYAALRYLVEDGLEAVVALSGLALVVSRPYWSDSFARLGPAEAYTILGSSLVLLAFAARFAAGDYRARWYWGSIAGTLFAAGSKENLLVLAVPLAALTIIDWRRLGWTLRAALVGALLLLIAEGVWVLHIVSAVGKDIYFNSAAVGERLTLLASFPRQREVMLTVVGAVAAVGAGLAWRARHDGEVPPGARQLTILGSLLAGCVVLAATQYFFYSGKLPAKSRYDFPYVMAFDVALVASIVVALRLVRAALSGRRLARPAMAALAGVAAAALAFPAYAGLKNMRANVAWWRTMNRMFDERMASAVDHLARTPGTSVVLQAGRGIDYEPVMSVQRHLAARNVSAPIFLAIAPGADGLSEDAWEAALLADMKRWSALGMERIRPLPQQGVGHCFGFGFHGPPPKGCASGVEIWPLDTTQWGWIE